jgi:hypothetical protein
VCIAHLIASDLERGTTAVYRGHETFSALFDRRERGWNMFCVEAVFDSLAPSPCLSNIQPESAENLANGIFQRLVELHSLTKGSPSVLFAYGFVSFVLLFLSQAFLRDMHGEARGKIFNSARKLIEYWSRSSVSLKVLHSESHLSLAILHVDIH